MSTPTQLVWISLPWLGLVHEEAVHLAAGFGMQCEAQSVPCSSAAQAICNDAVRPKLASQMCTLFVNKPLPLSEVEEEVW